MDNNKTDLSWYNYDLLFNSTEDCVINESPSWWQIARSTVTFCKNREFAFKVLRRVGKKGDAG